MFELEIDRKAPCVSHRRNHGPCRTRWPWNAFSFSITVVDFRERRQQAAGRQAILGQHLQILLDTVGEADVDHARIAGTAGRLCAPGLRVHSKHVLLALCAQSARRQLFVVRGDKCKTAGCGRTARWSSAKVPHALRERNARASASDFRSRRGGGRPAKRKKPRQGGTRKARSDLYVRILGYSIAAYANLLHHRYTSMASSDTSTP